MSADPHLNRRLRALARHLTAFESPGFRFGAWEPSWTDGDGVIHLGWYRLSPAAEALLSDAGAAGWIHPFDWGTWLASTEGRALTAGPEAISTATPDAIGRLLTAYVRAERFGDGTLEAAFKAGMLTAILKRAATLAAADEE